MRPAQWWGALLAPAHHLRHHSPRIIMVNVDTPCLHTINFLVSVCGGGSSQWDDAYRLWNTPQPWLISNSSLSFTTN